MIEYKTIENQPAREKYWFCHSCAKLVYETGKEFEEDPV